MAELVIGSVGYGERSLELDKRGDGRKMKISEMRALSRHVGDGVL